MISCYLQGLRHKPIRTGLHKVDHIYCIHMQPPQSLTFRRKVFKFLGAAIDVTDTATGAPVGFIKMRAFKLKEAISIYSDSSKSQEIMHINARKVIDFGATYDVYDTASQMLLFSMRRKGLKSTFSRDTWHILDVQGNEYGTVIELGNLAIYRRYIGLVPIIGGIFEWIYMFLAQGYQITYTAGGQPIDAGIIERQGNPFVVRLITNMDQAQIVLDQRIIFGIGAMISIFEAQKN